jgi:hypothetical protein
LLFGIYFIVFWFVMRQKAIYLPLLQEIGLWPRQSVQANRQSTSRSY